MSEPPTDTNRGFRDLHAWQRARAACVMVYRASRSFPDDERYGLISQSRRSAVSIASNIAEGYGRQSKADFLRHLRIARGSLFELQTQLIIASDLGYLSQSEQNAELREELESLSKVLSGLIRSVAKQASS